MCIFMYIIYKNYHSAILPSWNPDNTLKLSEVCAYIYLVGNSVTNQRTITYPLIPCSYVFAHMCMCVCVYIDGCRSTNQRRSHTSHYTLCKCICVCVLCVSRWTEARIKDGRTSPVILCVCVCVWHVCVCMCVCVCITCVCEYVYA